MPSYDKSWYTAANTTGMRASGQSRWQSQPSTSSSPLPSSPSSGSGSDSDSYALGASNQEDERNRQALRNAKKGKSGVQKSEHYSGSAPLEDGVVGEAASGAGGTGETSCVAGGASQALGGTGESGNTSCVAGGASQAFGGTGESGNTSCVAGEASQALGGTGESGNTSCAAGGASQALGGTGESGNTSCAAGGASQASGGARPEPYYGWDRVWYEGHPRDADVEMGEASDKSPAGLNEEKKRKREPEVLERNTRVRVAEVETGVVTQKPLSAAYLAYQAQRRRRGAFFRRPEEVVVAPAPEPPVVASAMIEGIPEVVALAAIEGIPEVVALAATEWIPEVVATPPAPHAVVEVAEVVDVVEVAEVVDVVEVAEVVDVVEVAEVVEVVEEERETGRRADNINVGVGRHPGASPGAVGRGRGRGIGQRRVIRSGRVEKPVTVSGGRRLVTKDYPARGVGRKQLEALRGYAQVVGGVGAEILVRGGNMLAGALMGGVPINWEVCGADGRGCRSASQVLMSRWFHMDVEG